LAYQAFKDGKSVRPQASEQKLLPIGEFDKLLDPMGMGGRGRTGVTRGTDAIQVAALSLRTRFLFWNVRKAAAATHLAALARTHALDWICLAEATADLTTAALVQLNSLDIGLYHCVPGLSNRVTIISRLPQHVIHPVHDSDYMSMRRVTFPAGSDYLLVVVHLPSKLWMSDDEQPFLATRVVQRICAEESRLGHCRTIVTGDFNMNPYENGMIAADAMHSVMTRALAAARERTVYSETKMFFFNPMWRLYAGNPPGSYFYPSGMSTCYWNLFDQVLVRPDLLTHFVDSDMAVLSKAGEFSLLNEHGLPNADTASDHLPITFSLEFEVTL
jgi:endonuclease/exonuclease/phosphatase family metal-dependent hydrolase